MKKGFLLLGLVFLSSLQASAHQLSNWKNHPALQSICERIELNLPFLPGLKMITGILITAALLIWVAYFVICFRSKMSENQNSVILPNYPSGPLGLNASAFGFSGGNPSGAGTGFRISPISSDPEAKKNDRE